MVPPWGMPMILRWILEFLHYPNTFYLGNYGAIVYESHAGVLASTVGVRKATIRLATPCQKLTVAENSMCRALQNSEGFAFNHREVLSKACSQKFPECTCCRIKVLVQDDRECFHGLVFATFETVAWAYRIPWSARNLKDRSFGGLGLGFRSRHLSCLSL